ncbi:unnamed protein product [Phyllotreta striolata]|uniref:Chitin-binding type-2 domain-containing protein n=1 Tax=Phyllotreta striolata TaxID=444603 RepID=A0A9N9TVI9_PHYSR|nr:unnamed protein product [Phyllotreta striolata]
MIKKIVILFASVFLENCAADVNLDKLCLKPNGQFPGTSCNKFVNCGNGKATEQNCPKDLYFSPKKLRCDYPANVDCAGQEELLKFCFKRRGVFPGTTCEKYVVCWDGWVKEIECQHGLLFSVTRGHCYWPHDVKCDNINLKKFCLKPRGQFPGTKCKKYVNCHDGIVVEQECPGNLIFSPTKLHCDHPKNVKCSDRKIEFIDNNKYMGCAGISNVHIRSNKTNNYLVVRKDTGSEDFKNISAVQEKNLLNLSATKSWNVFLCGNGLYVISSVDQPGNIWDKEDGCQYETPLVGIYPKTSNPFGVQGNNFFDINAETGRPLKIAQQLRTMYFISRDKKPAICFYHCLESN